MDLSLQAALSRNGYPGRGLVLSCDDSGWRVTYFLTGRSPASRDRELVVRDGAMCVQSTGDDAFDPLRHYRAAVVTPEWCVVGNGEQVEVVASRLGAMSPMEALQDLQYEPDPPLRTPRITAVLPREGAGPAFVSRAYASTRQPEHTMIGCWSIPALVPGSAVLTTTYDSEEASVVATDHPPFEVALEPYQPEELTAQVWQWLPPALRVAAMTLCAQSSDPVASAALCDG